MINVKNIGSKFPTEVTTIAQNIRAITSKIARGMGSDPEAIGLNLFTG
ncbi:MAG: hypothetical protein UU74_C0019G0008 [Candidatus Woesebacteria bacterium GW2011_GWA1_41_7]|uniref:Uncharacterized protein n=1 Tax=Candidatus Woesebacteria bacterium GW2011_GWA1_41_7 TaxID=1618556 RepID=A0A0G0WZX4_9BACT|nr:MAG: hypothetical protein UU74_C0019G0008 [Candidatus Woesebacteria bacterium GW2011_GWA1_41_7]